MHDQTKNQHLRLHKALLLFRYGTILIVQAEQPIAAAKQIIFYLQDMQIG